MKEAGELPWFGVAGGEWLLTTGDLKRVVVRISEIVAVVGKGNAGEKNPGASIRLRSAQSIYVDQSADEVLRAIVMSGERGEPWFGAVDVEERAKVEFCANETKADQPPESGIWVSNVSVDDPCDWCGFEGKFFGRPKPSGGYTVEQLESSRIRGLYRPNTKASDGDQNA